MTVRTGKKHLSGGRHRFTDVQRTLGSPGKSSEAKTKAQSQTTDILEYTIKKYGACYLGNGGKVHEHLVSSVKMDTDFQSSEEVSC